MFSRYDVVHVCLHVFACEDEWAAKLPKCALKSFPGKLKTQHMFSFKCEDARRRNVLNGKGLLTGVIATSKRWEHDEQVLKSVLKLAADADDGKEVESSDDAVESVEPAVDEADGNDEAEHCVAGPPKVPTHWHTFHGINIELPEKTNYY